MCLSRFPEGETCHCMFSCLNVKVLSLQSDSQSSAVIQQLYSVNWLISLCAVRTWHFFKLSSCHAEVCAKNRAETMTVEHLIRYRLSILLFCFLFSLRKMLSCLSKLRKMDEHLMLFPYSYSWLKLHWSSILSHVFLLLCCTYGLYDTFLTCSAPVGLPRWKHCDPKTSKPVQ